jgi:hypothetical protein
MNHTMKLNYMKQLFSLEVGVVACVYSANKMNQIMELVTTIFSW